MKATISLTHDCNLNCSYCYGGKKFNKQISLETAKSAIDLIFKKTNVGDELTIGFFGGEPLLEYNLVKELTKYIRDKEIGFNNQVTITITSNGTLLTDSILRFLRENNIKLCISIDGIREVHNKYRINKNGEGSFTQVYKNILLSRKILDTFQVNSVYSPDTIYYLPQTTEMLIKMEVPSIHYNINITADWSNFNTEIFNDIYRNISDIYIDNYNGNNEIAVNIIDSKIILLLKGGYSNSDICGMGETELGIAPSGNIYPCERLIGEDNNNELCIGNVENGFDEVSLNQVIMNRGNIKEECKKCIFSKYCMNWCGCTNHHMTGYTNYPSEILCQSEKYIIQNAYKVLETLQLNDLFIDHFYKYLVKDITEYQMKSLLDPQKK